MNFISELKRRNVIRMAGLYSSDCVGAFSGAMLDTSPKTGLNF